MENSEAFHEVISSSINSLFLNCICTCKDDYSLLKHMWKISHFLHWNSEEKIIVNFYSTVCVEKFDIGSLLARVCTTNSEVDLAKKTLIHVPICYGSPKKSKTKSFYKGHFYSIKIRWNSVVFWKMTENSLHRTDFFVFSQKTLVEWFQFLVFWTPQTCVNMNSGRFFQVHFKIGGPL